MTDERLPFLRGSIHSAETFQKPGQPRTPQASLPQRDPSTHSRYLKDQLAVMTHEVEARPAGTRDPEAQREIIAVNPAIGFALVGGSLGDKDVRVIGEDPASGLVLLDSGSADLPALRRKLNEYQNPEKNSEKSGAPRNAPLLAPIERIGIARVEDVASERVRQVAASEAQWLAIGCRGGSYDPDSNVRSRGEITRQLWRFARIMGPAAEFVAAMQIVFYVKLTFHQLEQVVKAVDCVYEVQLAERTIRDWLFLEHDEVDLTSHRMTPPPPGSPSVVILDSGIADGHVLLAPAVLSATSVVPGVASGVDVHGHGTEMAGIALHLDRVGDAVEGGVSAAPHWLQSVKIYTNESGTKNAPARAAWAPMTIEAVEHAEASQEPTAQVFAMAITARMENLEPTDWSQAIEQLGWNEGRGRLICISAGRADSHDADLIRNYPHLNLVQPIEDPAQAWNALTIGACTWRTQMPPAKLLKEYAPVAPAGGASPHTPARPVKADRVPNKPEVVFEGGNVAFDGALPDPGVGTLTSLTTGHRSDRPLASMWGTSEATARAAHLGARVWAADPSLRPATVRGLIVHAASWTPEMWQQFEGIDDRLAICGYGAPEFAFATACARDRATVIVEDSMPNGVIVQKPKKEPPKRKTTSPTEPKLERRAKFFRFPVDEELLLDHGDLDVELRVTLSYLPEVHTFRRRSFRGLDLRWDMQGPAETEDAFRWRVNKKIREQFKLKKRKGFPWTIGPKRRQRGTVQSDRWTGKASLLAGSKLFAVMPVIGWWDERKEFQERAQPFSLIVSVVAAGLDVYTPISVALEASASEITIDAS
ncbi:MAG: S8 family peptidase [Deltaproteobacteria bacterium]|nr:S8 family peptidase [Deltaproteobacteria bacterium]